MTTFKVETKNQVDIGKKPRVYFSCHPDDFEKYFRKICDDIFRTHDCAIYYTEDMTEIIAEDEKETSLGRNNLFVVPVTFRLLSKPNRAMDEDIPYAKKEHIPVLPIMMEPGIDEFYSKPDKFGEIQYLNPYSHDLTEISYEKKLKKYLESVLISDEMAKRVRAAFDAYIFLSYRKKDRKYANELMRIIHNIPECRDIAIWFDEFLTPGESFRENINKILSDSKLFALLVTPNLLEEPDGKPNFVMGEEYPLAHESGIDILPAEMVDTDKDTLKEKFEGIPDCVNPYEAQLRARLLETVVKLATEENNTPEHNFLIGLAYLDGIDVEVNRERAIEMITSAAEAELPEAMDKLYSMYSDGIGTNVDYRKAVKWAERIADYYTKNLGKEHPNTLTSLSNLALSYNKLGNYEKALELDKKVYKLQYQILGEDHPDTLISLSILAITYGELGDHKKSMQLTEKAYKLQCRILGEEHPDTLISLNNLAISYSELSYYKETVKLTERAYKLQCRILGEEHPDTLTSLNNLAVTYGNLGDHRKAVELKEKVYSLRCKILGEEHPDTLTSLGNLAYTYGNLGNHSKAIELYRKVYNIQCRVLGEEHPDTLISLSNLACFYGEIDDFKKELELHKKVYELRFRILGENHPDTLISLNNLAVSYSDIGDYRKSIKLTEKVYKLSCKILGEEHPDTLISLNNLAHSYGELGDHKKELKLYKKTYELFCKILGEEHPDAVKSLKHLLMLYKNLDNHQKVTQLTEKLYKIQCKMLGEEHPDTLRALNDLAVAYSYLGDIEISEYKKAIEYGESAYFLRCKVLGEDNTATLTSLNNLAFYYQAVGDFEKALPLYEKLYAQQTAVYGPDHPKTQKSLGRLEEVRKKLGSTT